MDKKILKATSSRKFILVLTLGLFLVVGIGIFIFYKLSPRPIVNTEYVQVCEAADAKCHQTSLPYQNATLPIETRVNDLLGRMTLVEKIGQMALIEKNSLSDFNDIAKYGLGGLLSGGGGKPKDNTPLGWQEMVENFQNYSQKTRLSIPLLYGIDANHGNGNVPGVTIFPHFIGLGASHDQDLVKMVAKATAEEVAAIGVNWIYSPDLDVARDLRWGRTYETFGSESELVSRLGQAYIEGLQSFSQDNFKIVATAKHFIGNGSSEWGSSTDNDFLIDQGNSNISEEELRQVDLEPFKSAIEAGVGVVMVGLNEWRGEKIVFNNYFLTEILKTELNFQGFVVSDWYGVYAQEENKYQALVKSINAGVDMVMLPYDYKFFSNSLHQAVISGDISEKRINDAVRRILNVKFASGLFDKKAVGSTDLEIVGSQAHRDLARAAVRESLVLLKNNQVLPISKKLKKILVAGSAANNLGRQSGGWTIEWQGVDGNWLIGTTILQGIQKAVAPETEVEYDLSGNFLDPDDLVEIGIAIVGEKPYAEGWGDNEDPKLSVEDLEAINNLKKHSQKIIVIIISGRPLNIEKEAENWDAVVAAWLPGSEGQGIADVLFGDYPFTGSLPVIWDL